MDAVRSMDVLKGSAKRLHMSPMTLKPIFDEIINEMRAGLIAGKRVVIPNLGALTPIVYLQPMPQGDEPMRKPGAPIKLVQCAKVSFVASKTIKELMKEKGGKTG